jgi:hypothetical protein
MRAQPSESLSEFQPEDGVGAGKPGDFVFDGETDPRPKVAAPGSLLDVVAAASPADTPAAPLSRIESRQARRRTSHLKRLARGTLRRMVSAAQVMGAASARAWAAATTRAASLSLRARSGTASAVRATGRVSAHARSSVRSAGAATRQHTSAAIVETSRLTQRLRAQTVSAATAASQAWAQTRSKARPLVGSPTSSRTVLEDLEFNGTIVVMSLAVIALAYGGFQRGARPAPLAPLSARAVETVPLEVAPPAPVMAVPPAGLVGVPPAPMTDAAVVTRPAKPILNASTLNAIWRRQDSRSLQQAFTGLRSQTLAFHRCGMRVTDADLAVATCEGAQRAKWTINFRRSAGRWLIDRVTTR